MSNVVVVISAIDLRYYSESMEKEREESDGWIKIMRHFYFRRVRARKRYILRSVRFSLTSPSLLACFAEKMPDGDIICLHKY